MKRFALVAVGLAIALSACTKKGQKTITETLPSGEKVVFKSVQDNPNIAALITQTITGKIESISNVPNPLSLPANIRRSTYFPSVVTKDGKRVIVVGEGSIKLLDNEGKSITFIGTLNRERAKIVNVDYPMYTLKEIKELK